MPNRVHLTFVTANVPESGKRGLDRDRRSRAKRFMRWANSVGADIVVTQESGTYLRAEVANNRPRWRASYPPPNDHIKERTAGNGQLSRRTWRIAGWARIPVPRTPSGKPLNQSVRLYRRRVGNGWAEVAVIGIHAQTRRADPLGRSRRRLARDVKAYSERLHRAGVPHIVAGDANNGKRSWARQFPHLKVAARHGVDWVLVSRDIGVRGHDVDRLLLVSDHAFVVAELAVPVRDNPTERLPRP